MAFLVVGDLVKYYVFPHAFFGISGNAAPYSRLRIAVTNFNMIASIGGFLYGLSQLLFLWIVIQACRKKGLKVGKKLWDGAHGVDALFTPQYHSFIQPPKMD